MKKTTLFALFQSALMVTLLVGAPLVADAASNADQAVTPGLRNIPKDDRISDTEADHTFRYDARPDRVTMRTDRDKALAEQVEKNIEPYTNIDVDAEEGTIRLKGKVDTVQERNTIIQRARSVYGVQSVEEDITVKDSKY